MFLADYHMHSTHSDDARDTMLAMARAAAANGVSQLCFTDHADECCDPKCLSFPPNMFLSQEGMYEEFESVRDELRGAIDVRFGAELASINHDPAKARVFWEDPRLDFIIGSVHNVRGADDFYFMDYKSEEQCRDIMRRYLEEYAEIARIGCCDVLGHIGYPQKYMVRRGFAANVLDYPDELRALFTAAAQNGVGVEVNTSGLRCSLGCTIPDARALRLYRECGGEIVTAGSDSHRTADAGAGLRETYELLRECGFTHVTVFKNHKPEFISIQEGGARHG